MFLKKLQRGTKATECYSKGITCSITCMLREEISRDSQTQTQHNSSCVRRYSWKKINGTFKSAFILLLQRDIAEKSCWMGVSPHLPSFIVPVFNHNKKKCSSSSSLFCFLAEAFRRYFGGGGGGGFHNFLLVLLEIALRRGAISQARVKPCILILIFKVIFL